LIIINKLDDSETRRIVTNWLARVFSVAQNSDKNHVSSRC